MNKNLTEIVFILDRSGSMSGLESDTIGGFNAMIEKQKKAPGEALVSTILFDNVSEVIHDRVNIRDIKPMTDREYCVRWLHRLAGCDWRRNPPHRQRPQVCARGRCSGAHPVRHHDGWNGKCESSL